MSVFLLQMAAIAGVDKRVWARSHIPPGARRNWLEKYTGIIGNVVWLLALGYSVFLPLQFASIWFYLGLFAFVIGVILLVTATVNFVTAPPDELVTTGAYRYSRHPMYLASLLICLGSGLAALSWLFILLSTAMAICFHREALIEERYCLDKYGNAYQQYRSRTPRWVGLPRRNHR